MRPPSVLYIRKGIHTLVTSGRITSRRSRAAPGVTHLRDGPSVPECAEFPATTAAVSANPQLAQQRAEPRSVGDRPETAPRPPATRNPTSRHAPANPTSIRCDIPRDRSQENPGKHRIDVGFAGA